MNDAALSALFGSARIQSITTGSTTQNSATVPPAVANLSPGTLIKGFVINRDRDNNPILRTQQGDLLVKSDVFLKTGSEVVIRVENMSGQQRARIMSVNGESIQQIQQRQEREVQHQNQDRVLQPSMMGSSKPALEEAILNKAQLLAEQKILKDMIKLEAMLLKPVAGSANPVMQQTMASVLKLPPSALHLLEKGAALEFRVIASDLNLRPATTAAPAATSSATPAPATTPPTTPAPATPATRPTALTQPVQMLYQLYNKLSAIPPLTTPASLASTAAPTDSASVPTSTPAIPASTAAPAPAGPSISVPLAPITTPPADSASSLIQQMAQAATSPAPPSSAAAAASPAVPASGMAPASPASIPVTPAATMPAPPSGTSPNPATPPAATTAPVTVASAPAMPVPSGTTAPQTAEWQTAAAPPGTITARVIGTDASGETIVRTPIGTIKLFTASSPPMGSVLQLQLVLPNLPQGGAGLPSPSPVSAPLVTFSTLAHDWAALDEAYQLLARTDPTLAREFAARVPNTKSGLVNSVLFFMSALNTGSVRNWLGARTAAVIEEKSSNLAGRLLADFTGIRAVLRDQPDQPWQMLPFPLMHEDELHQTRLFVRGDDNDDKARKDAAGTRFILEVSMSQLGEIQLDGLVRKTNGRTQFDLILRSEHPLPDAMQHDIQQLFSAGAEATGYTGSLRFQPDPARFVLPLADIRPDQTSADGHSIIA